MAKLGYGDTEEDMAELEDTCNLPDARELGDTETAIDDSASVVTKLWCSYKEVDVVALGEIDTEFSVTELGDRDSILDALDRADETIELDVAEWICVYTELCMLKFDDGCTMLDLTPPGDAKAELNAECASDCSTV